LKEYRTSLINTVVTKGLNPDVPMKESGIEWIGEIPSHWGVNSLKYNVNLQGRIGFKGYTKDDFVNEGEGCLVIGGKHIDKNNIIDLSEPDYLNWKKYYESPEIMVKKGDVIISQRGTLGKCLYIDKDYGELTINPSLVLVNNIKINPKYLWYNLQCNYLQSNIHIIGSTTTIPMLSQVEIGSFKIIIPTSEEQKVIVDYLECKIREIDTLVNHEQKKIELLKEYRQSLISNVVTGKIKVTE
jgi:type I restriction enzyme S subunit